MLDLIEKRILRKLGSGTSGSTARSPRSSRQQLVREFQDDPDCRLFLTTNAGSTGLNLQAANTVINVDLPWNPAVLEQRIARAHRMGQRRPVQVYVLVTEGTIEEDLLRRWPRSTSSRSRPSTPTRTSRRWTWRAASMS